MTKFSALIRDAPIGQLIRLATGSRFLRFPEEEPGFQLPWEAAQLEEKAVEADEAAAQRQPSHVSSEHSPAADAVDPEKPINTDHGVDHEALTHAPTARSNLSRTSKLTTSRTVTREQTRPYTAERFEAEQEEAIDRAQSAVIIPTRTADGVILVDWYTTDDPENPQNWSSWRKSGAVAIIFFYTFTAYASSATYTSSVPGVMERFNVSVVAAGLGLSMYVIGYGTGPLLFSPISEIPVIGRNWPYIISYGLFVILAVPTALADSFASLLVLRFITGYFSSPALATGGASMGDLYNIIKLPYALTAWTAAAFCAPAFGPLLSGFAVMNENWRWSLWINLWMSAPVFLIMLFFMPETSAGYILLHRARRLRKLTGNPMLKSQSEIDQAGMDFKHTLWEALARPIEICIKDPGVLFTNIYTSCIYGIYYSFFEVFPLVYVDIYGFNLGELGLPFLVISIGCAIGVVVYCSYVYYFVEPKIKKHGLGLQEDRLIPAIFSTFLLPIGLFWFGWSSRESVHWIVATIGLTLFPIGAFILFQCIFIYLPLTYPQYAASLFAANDLCRSALASGSILYAHPLFVNLGIGPGVSLLAGLLCLGVVGVWGLYYFGASLRARSKFALS
ncbi:Transporter mfs1 [Cyphellophora attinorum]|uniref:Transporter mfs1 n=1 Tax=Cyphellophora attinorum TaxID=1664694 RepID=A0A0N1H4X6_9EURO|nr:Transporter mfs1 [Phialophora attinorum]KPI36576.1 Transporter mfs1 [Phialophora attinorum]